jgi:hypothetical protein
MFEGLPNSLVSRQTSSMIRCFLLFSVVFCALFFGPTGSSHPLPDPTVSDVSIFSPTGLVLTASGTPLAGKVPLNVSFTGTVSGGTPPYALLWDFGDGTSKIGQTSVSHVYKVPGNFTVQFWAQDSGQPALKDHKSLPVQAEAVGSLLVTVVDKSQIPVAGATVRVLSGPAGQQLLSLTTVQTGRANFTGIAAGVYSLEVSATGFSTNTITVTVTPGSPVSYTVLLTVPASSGQSLSPLAIYIAFVAIFVGLILLRQFRRTRRSMAANPVKPRGRSLQPRLPPVTPRGCR